MKTKIKNLGTGRTWNVWTSTDGTEWNLTTATRSPTTLQTLINTIRHNGKHVAIVLSTARLQKVLKPLDTPAAHPAPRKPARPTKTGKTVRTELARASKLARLGRAAATAAA